jgi:hypothetical protein|nr:MAG TPA: hypothetical protein [Caudoviricetes sp.]
MGRVIPDLSSIKFVSQRGLRDYAFKALKGEVGEHVNKGVIIPGKYTDRELRAFVEQMPDWQLRQMYDLMYGSEMVE